MAVGVIGAGPAGITAAYQLAKAGVDVHVFEAGDCAGGLARSLRLWNQTVDLGPHRFFSTDARVNALWLEIAGGDYTMVKRFTRILYGGRLFNYPLRPLNALSQLGVSEAARCIASFAREKIFPDSRVSRDTFEGWVTSRFGRRLFEIFFKTYSEKLWGIPCDALDADFAAQRIKKLDLFEAIANALRGAKGAAKHRTLVDEFAYPLGGTGSVYTRMAYAVSAREGRVHLNTRVQRVLTKANRAYALELESGEVRAFDAIVSSMPISLLTSRLPYVPEAIGRAANSLKFRNTVIVFLKIDADGLFPDQWIYVHSEGVRAGRITNFRNWAPSLYGEERASILALEYWANDDDALWGMDSGRLIDLGTQELLSTGLIERAPVSGGHVVKIRRCYPVYERGYKQTLKPVEEYLSRIEGLQVIGRYGAFKYNNQDHSILMGLLAAANILEGASHNLWEINSDYESYQEAARITETGLAAVSGS